MTLKGRDFFKQPTFDLPTPAPKIPPCIDCFEEANPAWRDGVKVYCRTCAPPDLKRPKTNKECRDAMQPDRDDA